MLDGAGKEDGMRVGSGKRLRSRSAWIMAAAVAVAFMLASCTPAAHVSSPGAVSSHSGSVVSLNNITTLKSQFNRGNGHPRLVLIFSPT